MEDLGVTKNMHKINADHMAYAGKASANMRGSFALFPHGRSQPCALTPN
jgi:hypothetical protein